MRLVSFVLALLFLAAGCRCDPGDPVFDSGDSKPASESEPPGDSDPIGETDPPGDSEDSVPPVHTGDSNPGHTGDSQGETAPENPGPDIPHVVPGGGSMCFNCHLCGEDDVPNLDVSHYVCVECHVGPDGSVPEELMDTCGCESIDCDADPPVVGCDECHTDGKNDLLTSDEMNDLCMGTCHQPDDGEDTGEEARLLRPKRVPLFPPEEVELPLIVGIAEVGVGAGQEHVVAPVAVQVPQGHGGP